MEHISTDMVQSAFTLAIFGPALVMWTGWREKGSSR